MRNTSILKKQKNEYTFTHPMENNKIQILVVLLVTEVMVHVRSQSAIIYHLRAIRTRRGNNRLLRVGDYMPLAFGRFLLPTPGNDIMTNNIIRRDRVAIIGHVRRIHSYC